MLVWYFGKVHKQIVHLKECNIHMHSDLNIAVTQMQGYNTGWQSQCGSVAVQRPC